MNEQFPAVLNAAVESKQFPQTSRYYEVELAERVEANGRRIAYLRRRFAPPPEKFVLMQEHTVAQGERLDNIAAHYLGDPEQFWRLCDANGAIRPNELTETAGRAIRITLPAGIPGQE